MAMVKFGKIHSAMVKFSARRTNDFIKGNTVLLYTPTKNPPGFQVLENCYFETYIIIIFLKPFHLPNT